eukprot:TRINITY_DN67825_c0_g1_i1.p1 TRINITY_DN67825_c0_g1~~TRINITY_DN67825_c0_g1_i1.p1  ORF type:complete len:171 (+),score=50.11 TRINITY_DN67825_c0_g1_i1:52-564(+)
MAFLVAVFVMALTLASPAAAVTVGEVEDIHDMGEVDRVDEFGDDAVVGDDDESVEMQLMEASFTAGDADGNGKLSREEALALAKSQNPTGGDDPEFVKDVLRDFEEYDSDRDNELTLAEFVEMLDSFGKDPEEDERDEDHHGSDYGGSHGALGHNEDQVDESHDGNTTGY